MWKDEGQGKLGLVRGPGPATDRSVALQVMGDSARQCEAVCKGWRCSRNHCLRVLRAGNLVEYSDTWGASHSWELEARITA